VQIINLSVDRMGDLSFAVQTNVRHQTKESNEWLKSLLEKSKYAKTLMKSESVSLRAKHDLKELNKRLKQLDSTMKNSVKWNTPQMMGDRHIIFEDQSTWAQDIRKTKFYMLGFFWPPL
jgi:predicted phage-related endonuclease